MSQTRFILVRHGQTEWNAVGREMGQLDSPLTTLGVRQAELLANRLARSSIARIYCSDLPRAARTAEIVARHCGITVVPDCRLRERHMGIFQGLTPVESAERYPLERAAYQGGGFDYVIPQGESARQRSERTVACLDELVSRHEGQTTLVVAHWGTLLAAFENVFGLHGRAKTRIRLPNTALNVFTHGPAGWALEVWGDVSHLEASAS